MPYVKRRIKLIADFGGACQICGYKKSIRALHFHHLDTSEKYNTEKWGQQAETGRATTLEIENYPKRFMLVCANCHAELHDKEALEKIIYANCQSCGKEFRTEAHRASVGRGKYCSKECTYAGWNEYAISFASLEKRFWKYVVIQDGCWDWNGSFEKHGTPKLNHKNSNGKPTMKLATRISYQIHFGEIPQGKRVSRTCGNLKCLNPEHLRLK